MAGSTVPRATPPPSEVTLDVLTVNGSGCPAGTAHVSASPDNTAFRVTYRDFVAQTGGGAAPSDLRRNCQIAVLVNVPHGFTYAVAEARYRGQAHLARGASGLHRAAYYFQGHPENAYSTHEFSGPHHDGWETSDKAAALVFAPCGARHVFNINTELRVNAGSVHPQAMSFLSMRSMSGSVNTLFQLAWKRCP